MSSWLICVVILFLSTVFKVETTLSPFELGPVVTDFAQKLRSVCFPRSGTNDDAINEVKNGKFTDEPKMKAYMKCLLLESKTMDDKGEIDAEVAPRLAPDEYKDKIRAVTETCSDRIKDITELEKKAFAWYKCAYNQYPDVFVFF